MCASAIATLTTRDADPAAALGRSLARHLRASSTGSQASQDRVTRASRPRHRALSGAPATPTSLSTYRMLVAALARRLADIWAKPAGCDIVAPPTAGVRSARGGCWMRDRSVGCMLARAGGQSQSRCIGQLWSFLKGAIIKGLVEVYGGHADDLRSTSSNVNVGERPTLGCQ